MNRENRRKLAEDAARYAHDKATTLEVAAATFDVHSASVSRAWKRLFGGSAARGRRGVSHPEDEVTL